MTNESPEEPGGTPRLAMSDLPLSVRLCVGLVIAGIVTAAFGLVESVFRPFFVALFLAYAFKPLTDRLSERTHSRLLGYALAGALVFGSFTAAARVIAFDLRRFEDRRVEYSSRLSTYEEQLTSVVAPVVRAFERRDASDRSKTKRAAGEDATPEAGGAAADEAPGEAEATPQDEAADLAPPDEAAVEDPNAPPSLMDYLDPDYLLRLAGLGTTAVFGFVGDVVVVLVFMLLIMLELDRVPYRIRAAFPSEQATRIILTIADAEKSVERYLVLKIVVSAITAGACALVLFGFGVHYVLTFSLLIFLFNFIPYVGSVIATVLPTAVCLLQRDPWTAAGLAISLTAVQQIVGNFLEPKIQGKGLQLSPVVILLALGFWGWLWGITGMILAVPITASLRIVLDQFDSTAHIARLMGDVETRPGGAKA